MAYFYGSISEIAIYNKALPATRIAAHYAAATTLIQISGTDFVRLQATITSTITSDYTRTLAAVSTNDQNYIRISASVVSTGTSLQVVSLLANVSGGGTNYARINTSVVSASTSIDVVILSSNTQQVNNTNYVLILGAVTSRVTDYVRINTSAVAILTDYIQILANAVLPLQTDYVQILANVSSPNFEYLRILAAVGDPNIQYVLLNTSLASTQSTFVLLQSTLGVSTNGFAFLSAHVVNPATQYVLTAAAVSFGNTGFVLLQSNTIGGATSFVSLASSTLSSISDIVRLEAAVRNFGQAVPGDGGIVQPIGSTAQLEDFLSSQIASGVYSSYSKIILNGTTLLVTSFRPNVISFQTRAKPWLNRQDVSSGGVYSTTSTKQITNPDGSIDTIVTTTAFNQDQTTVTEVRTNSGVVNRVNKVIRIQHKDGRESVLETTTGTVGGVSFTSEKKTLSSQPPTQQNRQPIQVKTLDGVTHYQWYGSVNPDWSTGDQFGTTTTETRESSVVNDDGTVTKTQSSIVTKPTGEITNTLTQSTGVDPNLGTTAKQTNSEFTGTTIKKTETSTLPNGQVRNTTTLTQFTGDSASETTHEETTDEFGQLTVVDTTVLTERTTGQTKTTTTTTRNVGGVSKTTTTVSFDDNFENQIADNKIQVFLINEFAITAIMEEPLMLQFFEIAKKHSMSYALQELYNQKLSGNRLSYAFRQNLVKKYDNAVALLAPITLNAFNNEYKVVFASSSTSFVPEYLAVEPHIYKVQFVLQERTDLTRSL